MLVVSNTSPITNLAIIGRLELLRRRYERVLIPPDVASEIDALSHPAAKARVSTAFAEGWLQVEASASQQKLPMHLDSGETAAIRLAIALKADLILLDERKARSVARQLGLTVAGVLGELLHAKSIGIIPAVRPELTRLRTEAGFFIDAEIESFILASCGE